MQNDWEVVKRGWDAQVLGEAPFKFRNAVEAVKQLRQAPKASDQYLPPFVIADESGKPVGPIVDVDAVVTIHFRADRMVLVAKAFEYEDFDKFDRVRVPKIRYAGMLQYDGELKLPSHNLVSPPEISSAQWYPYVCLQVSCRPLYMPFLIIVHLCVLLCLLAPLSKCRLLRWFSFCFCVFVCVFCIFFFFKFEYVESNQEA